MSFGQGKSCEVLKKNDQALLVKIGGQSFVIDSRDVLGVYPRGASSFMASAGFDRDCPVEVQVVQGYPVFVQPIGKLFRSASAPHAVQAISSRQCLMVFRTSKGHLGCWVDGMPVLTQADRPRDAVVCHEFAYADVQTQGAIHADGCA